MSKIIKLILCIALCQAAGIVGSIFTFESVTTWYLTLSKPFFNPPNWIFGPVWTTLYTLMGISLFMFWISKGKNKKRGYKIFFAQLILNTIWSIMFFGLQSPAAGLLIILILLTFIALTIKEFRKVSKPAAYLLIPYIAWVSFASILNLSIFLLNSK